MASKHKKNNNNNNIKRISLNDLITIEPLTEKQKFTFDSYKLEKHLILHGIAGTGKTFLSMYLTLEEVLDASSVYDKLIIVRSIVPTRDIGFLPGTEEEKTAVYEGPYQGAATKLFENNNAYKELKAQGKIVFTNTSFIRGINIDNAIVIVDEMQNLTFHELDSVITRFGENAKFIYSGDYRQTDLHKSTDKKGILQFMEIMKQVPNVEPIEFGIEDIVRSTLVKNYIIAKYKLGYND